MEALLRALLRVPECAALAQAVERGECPAAASGLSPVHRAQISAALSLALDRPLAVVCADEEEARRLAADLSLLLGTPAVKLFARELHVRAGAVASRQWELERIAALCALAGGKARVVVATAEGLLQKTSPPERMGGGAVLKVGGRYDLGELASRLTELGYSRCDQVEGPGQFAVRGGILDVYGPGMDAPARCEFFGDEADSLGSFDVATQRRTKNIDSAALLPARELPPGVPPASAFDYLPVDALLCVSEDARVGERVKNVLWQAREDTEALLAAGEKDADLTKLLLTGSEWTESLARFPALLLSAIPSSRTMLRPRTMVSFAAKQLSAYGGSVEAAAGDLRHYRETGYAALLLCGSEARCRNIQRMLEERDLPAALDYGCERMPGPGEIRLAVGALSAGAEYPPIALAVLTEGQLTAPVSGRRPRSRGGDSRKKLLSYTDLAPGDLVVHRHHGVGRFEGIRRMPVDGVEKDYIKIAYAGGDSLYVPATQLDLVTKYIGAGGGEDGEERPARLNKLGGADWNRQRSRARAAARDLAKGLIALYAERQRRPGFAFSPDSPWQREFEESFDYEETEDQLRCVEEIKADMEKPVPMDRLLCGDVGYGKTEVALRAVMKCVLDGKQAAILAPTTVLAQQHYATAVSRFRGFPVEIRVLSRFQSAAQTKKILAELKEGRVDLLIGTHRLLQKNVEFRDLGLLVVDEEQRFGVSHKEKLKEMSRQVDVLTLTATPIPRTLNMALTGIRDMSTLEEPPQDRQPVQTYVVEHDWGLLADAMRRELGRGGQVYYLHNRVESIDAAAGRIRALLGDGVTVAVAHGQMDERQLSSVMQKLVDGDVQVLVCTTIIETGIDVPNVNTLIIADADRFGLSQLHQIRGRIGRSARRAYAYMTYRPGKVLSEVASRRLTAIREYVEFGSGFKIAMRDLEIRGAGNLLGAEQSGYMSAVGYDMYLQLLEDAVLEEKGEKKPRAAECSADLTVSANIPESYIASAGERMDMYRRIAAVRTQDDAGDIVDELMDRYGDPPKSVYALLDVALLRAAAARAGVSDISQRGDALKFTLAEFDAPAVARLCADPRYRRRLTLSAGEVPAMTLTVKDRDRVLETALELVEALAARETAAPPPGGAPL